MILYYENSNSLAHHGIKGQKWGVRRFQNEDGTLTKRGRERYESQELKDSSVTKKKSKHRLALEQSYLNKGLSQEEAEKKASDRIRTEKIVGVAAGVTLAAGAAYLAYKHLNGKADGVVKAGTELQRIESDGSGTLHDVFYAAKNRVDKTKYAGELGLARQAQTGHAFLMKIGVGKDVKVAGQAKARTIFKDLYKNDPDFRDKAEWLGWINVHGKNEVLKETDFKKMYDNFNSNLVANRDNPAVTKFYNALKSAGYGAIRDINDMKFSGYNAENPLIFFDNSSAMTVKTVKELSENDMWKNMMKAGATEVAEQFTKETALYGSIGVTTAAAGIYIDSARRHATGSKTLNKLLLKK